MSIVSKEHLQREYEALERNEGHRKAVEKMAERYPFTEEQIEQLIVRVENEIEGA